MGLDADKAGFYKKEGYEFPQFLLLREVIVYPFLCQMKRLKQPPPRLGQFPSSGFIFFDLLQIPFCILILKLHMIAVVDVSVCIIGRAENQVVNDPGLISKALQRRFDGTQDDKKSCQPLLAVDELKIILVGVSDHRP